MPPRAARPLSRSQLAFESLLEREDDGQDPVQLPPRGQRNPKKKKEGGRGGGGRDVAGFTGFFPGRSERERAGNELQWRAPMVGCRHACEAPSLVALPLVFQSLVNAFS